ncbi:LysR family transcriptional regulator [Streptomyces sp. A7024]|uniref:LysR family transcriptional regulator n=1 Tax=Streptomyces coryli TaxID=1128680 RepID=A0A6G4UDF1_9ACTN|nr:LysR family transcriptional regulator [Streptomyces coryli]NGN70255.1 LysR family transcriptional regulator [Streptomyces coryli]
MEIRQLATFLKTASVLSFTRAAADLNYAQSSVTGQIKALEADLGVALFDRLGGRIQLTDAGRRLVPYAEQLLALADEARADVGGAVEPAGSLVVGTMESLTSYRMPPLLELFQHRYPKVELALRPSICAETLQGLRQGTYDLGFLMEQATEHEGVEVAVLGREPLALVAAPGHELAGVAGVETGWLERQTVLATEVGCAYREGLRAALGEGAGTFREYGTIEAIKRGVAAGLGIALLPAVTVAEEIATGRLARLDWEPPFTLYTQLAWRRGKRLTREQRLFVDEAVRLVAEEATAVVPLSAP